MYRAIFISILFSLLTPIYARAQCNFGSCNIGGWSSVNTPAYNTTVRVRVDDQRGYTSYGSGVLVEVTGNRGLVLSCAHLFDPAGPIFVMFPTNRQWVPGRLLHLDKTYDLSVIIIENPPVQSASIYQGAPQKGISIRFEGYQRTGILRAILGKVLGYTTTRGVTTYETIVVSGAAQDGDSGGPIYSDGKVIGIIWGTDGQKTYGTYCGRILVFLEEAKKKLQPPFQEPAAPSEGISDLESSLAAMQSKLQQLEERLAAIEQAQTKVQEITAQITQINTRVEQIAQSVQPAFGQSEILGIIRSELERLPPIRIQSYDPDTGVVYWQADVHLGQTVRLPGIEVHHVNKATGAVTHVERVNLADVLTILESSEKRSIVKEGVQ